MSERDYDEQPATDDLDTRYGEEVEDLEDDAAEWAEPIVCPVCGGPAPALGALGRLLWHRCRRCGSETAVDQGVR